MGPPTGILFDEQTPEALADAVRRFDSIEHLFQRTEIRKNAELFAAARFRREIGEIVSAILRKEPE